jgi:hypothetical protein
MLERSSAADWVMLLPLPNESLRAVSASSSLATAAATPSKTARRRSGRSKMWDEFAWRMYLCCRHAGWMKSPSGGADSTMTLALSAISRTAGRSEPRKVIEPSAIDPCIARPDSVDLPKQAKELK